jgi:PleD family two-component response regulator
VTVEPALADQRGQRRLINYRADQGLAGDRSEDRQVDTADELLAAADAALLEAKRTGRDRVVAARQPPRDPPEQA